MSRRLLPLLLLVLLCPLLHAQARLAIYGTVGGETTGLGNEGWSTAGTVGAYHDFAGGGPISLAFDGRADLSTNVNSFLFGPRLAVHAPAFPIKPYGEFLVGASWYRPPGGTTKGSSDFIYRWVGGIDSAILPHVDWRVFDFSYGGGISNATVHQKSLTTGLVVRF
jgi:hypothetical protein